MRERPTRERRSWQQTSTASPRIGAGRAAVAERSVAVAVGEVVVLVRGAAASIGITCLVVVVRAAGHPTSITA